MKLRIFVVLLLSILFSMNETNAQQEKTYLFMVQSRVPNQPIGPGSTFCFPTCVCVTQENCPCDCERMPILWPDVVFRQDLNLTTVDGRALTLLEVKGDYSQLFRHPRSHQWIGQLHNIVVAKAIARIEARLNDLKANKMTPTRDELFVMVDEEINRGYKEVGFSGSFLEHMSAITDTVLASVKSANGSNVEDKILRDNDISLDSGTGRWFKQTFDHIDRTPDVRSLNCELLTMDKRATMHLESDREYLSVVSSNSVARASYSFWTSFVSDPGTSVVAKEATDIKKIGKADFSGCVGGFAAGWRVPIPGPWGKLKAGIAGCGSGAIAGSVGAIAEKIWDAIF